MGDSLPPIPATQPHRKATFARKIRDLYHKIESFSGYKISTSRIAFTSRVTSTKITCNPLFFCVRCADVYKAIFRLVRKHTVVAQQIFLILLVYCRLMYEMKGGKCMKNKVKVCVCVYLYKFYKDFLFLSCLLTTPTRPLYK
nr:MAG TPA: hypothetical protein [Caudoviricetes sp.]